MDIDKIVTDLLEDIRKSPLGPDRTMLRAGMAASTYYRWQAGDFRPTLTKMAQIRATLDEIHREHQSLKAQTGGSKVSGGR